MTCRKRWVRKGGEKFRTVVTAEANVQTMTGWLAIVDASDHASSPPSKAYSREDLEAGVDIKLKAAFTYTLIVIVTPKKSGSARVHTRISFDDVEKLDDTCERDATDPICEWRVVT